MAYLLDANVFIEAHRRYYGFDLCPGFWDWIERENRAGRVFSIEKVGDELLGGSDALATWVETVGSSMFRPPDPAMLTSLAQVVEWVSNQKYTPGAINTFLTGADCYLVSYALAHAHTVVTHEIPSNAIKRVKIPEVCIGAGVKFVDTFTMLKNAHTRFVLKV